MADDRDIDRKAATHTPDDRSLRDRLPTVRLPVTAVTHTVVGALYVSFAVGALSVAIGATAIMATHTGLYAGVVTAGAFATMYGYAGLRLIDHVRRNR